ncbi:polyprenyl synthetase family protein [Candidatus Micrarchaeota archaeon]|nr:polyprenyl synthetase family protein [Candidatus Micrarchaeota archaeon]
MSIENYVDVNTKLIGQEMERYIPKEPKEIYSIIREFISRGGKRVRPILLLTVVQAVGGGLKTALPYAVILELFHNFTLIHDDIEDGSQVRRGKQTLHISHGIPVALNTGDALYTLVMNSLLTIPDDKERLLTASRMLTASFREVVEGQGIELEWYRTNRMNIEEYEYFEMVKGKTASLIGLSCSLGAYLGGADKNTIEKMDSFGKNIGLSFQIRDDVLNLIGSEEKYKKEIGGDVREGKRSLISLHALNHLPEDEKETLKNILLAKENSDDEIKGAIELMKKAGSIKYASGVSEDLHKQALEALEILPESEHKMTLKGLVSMLRDREV